MSTPYQEVVKLEEKLRAHRHCAFCGKAFVPTPPQQIFCSDECTRASKKREKWAKLMFIIPLIILVILFLLAGILK
jgi:predicted nucleic acid-binding Zn ribbon protein